MPIAVEIVTQEKVVFSEPEADMVIVPAMEGEMGVLPGHAPMIVTLRGGVISVTENGQVTDRLFVAGGFAEVTPERCTVLADEVTPVAQLSRAAAESRIRDAEEAYAIATAETPEKRDAAMDRLLSARAMLQAAEAA